MPKSLTNNRNQGKILFPVLVVLMQASPLPYPTDKNTLTD